MSLILNKIFKSFNSGTLDEISVFDDFNLKVNSGEFVSIIGSNGSGKTTLLNLISGCVNADKGSIILEDNDITKMPEYKRAKTFGRVFQNPAAGTVPAMTIAQNLAIADNKGKPYGLKSGINKKRMDYYRHLLSPLKLGLEDKLNTKASSLSGGQRQALALIMCSMNDLKLLLLDEHTAALDPNTSEKIMELTDSIIKQKKITTLMVTHNLKFALNYGSRLLMLDKGKITLDVCDCEKQSLKINDLLRFYTLR